MLYEVILSYAGEWHRKNDIDSETRKKIEAMLVNHVRAGVLAEAANLDANYREAILPRTFSVAPTADELTPTALPDHPKVHELVAALSAAVSAPEKFKHLINAAAFEIIDKVTSLICDVEAKVPVVGTTAIGIPGAGKSQANAPLMWVFDDFRVQGLVSANLTRPEGQAFRVHTAFKSPQDIRDKSRSALFDLILIDDADDFFAGMDASAKGGKYSGMSSLYIADYDGKAKKPATGANATDGDYVSLMRPVKQYTLNTQPELIAPAITRSVVSKGTLSRFFFMFIPKIDCPDGDTASFDIDLFVVPDWVEDMLRYYMQRVGTKAYPRAAHNFRTPKSQKPVIETRRRQLVQRFPSDLENALAHFTEATTRAARMLDALDLDLSMPHSDHVATQDLSPQAIAFGLIAVEQSYTVLHHLDGQYGLGMIQGQQRYRLAWKGILGHLREQEKKGNVAFRLSRADQLADNNSKYVISDLVKELSQMSAVTIDKGNGRIKVVDFTKAIAIALNNLLEAGGVDEPYKNKKIS